MEKFDFTSIRKQISDDLVEIRAKEQSIFQDLEGMLAKSHEVEKQISHMTTLMPTLDIVMIEAESLADSINSISEDSEKISNEIRSLDMARNRVKDCQQRVNDLIDLEVCSQGVQMALQQLDYEKAAAHIHRFLSIDQDLVERTTTRIHTNNKSTQNTAQKSIKTLEDAATQLRRIVCEKFQESVQSGDLNGIERFFKMYPLVGLHHEGIVAFCTFLRTKIASQADKNLQMALSTPLADKRQPIIFADTLTLLFEGVAKVIDTHQPLIETYYGPGRLLDAIRVLQNENDAQTKRILTEWHRDRQISSKLQQINIVGGSKLEKIEPKQLDTLVGEIALMHYRIELYISFIRRKILSDAEAIKQNPEHYNKLIADLDTLRKSSEMCSSKHELLSHYLTMEQYFLTESICKAAQMDCLEAGQQTSSIVDDTFFIVKKCIRRSISTGSLDGVCAIINYSVRVLENDFCGVLRQKLRQGYPSGYLDLTQAYNVLQSSIQQGWSQGSRTDTAEQNRISFLVTLNNASTSVEYVETLCQMTQNSVEQILPTMKANERGKLESCLSGLTATTATLNQLIEYGIEQLRTTSLKPRISTWVDAFLNENHQLSDEDFNAYEGVENFAQILIQNLDTLLVTFQDNLTVTNYDNLVEVMAAEVAQRWEKTILKCAFNRLGGLVLDKEVRSLAAYMTTITSWSVRDKFSRLTQIATVLNLEQVSEMHDYWGNHDGALTWRLTPSEVRQILMLRSDFRIDDIRKLRLS